MENTIGLCLINIINSISGKYKKKTSFVIVKYACMYGCTWIYCSLSVYNLKYIQ